MRINLWRYSAGKVWFELHYQSRYDQLNRITRMQVFENPNIAPGQYTWSAGNQTFRYMSDFRYDQDGNITNLRRRAASGVQSEFIDDLSYHYTAGTNRLDYVYNQGNINPTDHPHVPPQSAGNYQYDGSGNLISDESEDIHHIAWTPYGKVSAIIELIQPFAGEYLLFGYNPNQQRIKKQKVRYQINLLEEGGTSRSVPEPQEILASNAIPIVVDTLFTTWYIRDATGNVLAVYQQVGDTITWTEQHLYGSSRLGMVHPQVVWKPEDKPVAGIPYFKPNKNQVYGAKRYEITNHLGNVAAVVSDRKTPFIQQSQVYFDAVVHSASDYFPFGSLMTERSYSANWYRFGFNTQERDDEVKGEGNHYSAEFWQYDPRVVHRWNLDPRPNSALSGYAILGGNPIYHTDWAGDTLDIANNSSSLSDITSLPNAENRGLVKFSGNGEFLRVNLDFGELSESEIKDRISQDEGLSLLNDLVTSKYNYLYEAAELALLRDEQGRPYGVTMYQDDNGVVNASVFGKDSRNANTLLPALNYHGHVIISIDGTWSEFDRRGNIVPKSRASIVFHELAESYERTSNKRNYHGGLFTIGAHDAAIRREYRWHGRSNTPGAISPNGYSNPHSRQTRGLIFNTIYSHYIKHGFHFK